MDFFTYLIITAVLFTASYLLTPKPKGMSLSPDMNLQLPTATEGTGAGVIFGTAWVEDPIIAWFGDISASAIKKESGGK
jgi:hypothetical protein